MAKSGELSAELRAIRHAVEHLPERIASHMMLHLQGSKVPHLNPAGGRGRMQQWTLLLKTALPYVELTRRAITLLFLWGLITSGALNADLIAQMILKWIKGTW